MLYRFSLFNARTFLFVCALVFCSITTLAEEKIITGTPLIIEGVSDELKENIQLILEMNDGRVPFSILGFPRSNEYIKRAIVNSLQSFGFYEANIELNGDHNGWIAKIDLGSPILWQEPKIEIDGNSEIVGLLKQELNLVIPNVGSRVNHKEYEQIKSSFIQSIFAKGYLDARFVKSSLLIDLEQSLGKIDWHLDVGEIYTLNSVNFEGSSLSREFLWRYVFLEENTPYSQSLVFKTQQSLNRSGYFKSVNIEQQVNSNDQLVDLVIQLDENEKYEFRTSVGYGTDSGTKLGFGWSDQRVNDFGHNYLATLDLSKIEQSTAFQYTMPLDGQKNEWINRFSYRIRDDDVARSDLTSFESRVIRQHNLLWSSQFAVTVATESIAKNEAIESYLEYLVPSWQISYYSVDDPFTAQNGWRWQSRIRVGLPELSDPSLKFFQWEQRIKSIWQISDRWRALYRGHLTLTDMNTDDFVSNMPISYRNFAGGDVSVRGYRYQTISPVDSEGNLIGGKHLTTHSLEFDWQFIDNWRWALFTDAGDAFNDKSQFELKNSVGTGVRWVTPVGSIRIDYAKALDEQKEWRFHISIGPDL